MTSLTRLFDFLFAPVAISPGLAVAGWGVVLGVVAAVVLRRVGNQRELARLLRLTRAELLAIRLFPDEGFAALRSVGRIAGYGLLRLWHSLPAAVVLLVPLAIVGPQLALRFDHRPLEPSVQALVTLKLSPETWTKAGRWQIVTTPGARPVAGPLRDEDRHSIYWRIGILGSKGHDTGPVDVAHNGLLRFQLQSLSLAGEATSAIAAEADISKSLTVASDSRRLAVVSERRTSPGWLNRIVDPAEAPLPEEHGIQSIEVRYPERAIGMLGFEAPWWVTLSVVATLVAIFLRPRI